MAAQEITLRMGQNASVPQMRLSTENGARDQKAGREEHGR